MIKSWIQNKLLLSYDNWGNEKSKEEEDAEILKKFCNVVLQIQITAVKTMAMEKEVAALENDVKLMKDVEYIDTSLAAEPAPPTSNYLQSFFFLLK